MSGPGQQQGGGGGIVLARKKDDGTTAYATITDQHLSHLIDKSEIPNLTAKLSSLKDD